MHKTKKFSKVAKVPKPIKIKKEKTEEDRSLHPMSHYIDDRLELVKQIFGSLKPKTIINLAPDFLKKKNMDDIEELCLNELLCISTKRLLSIINATKCPTDTESSSDSDVQRHEEHISLEEISSDSEIEGSATKTGKRKSNGTGAKTGAKKEQKYTAGTNEDNAQISVLELLELQARARAIRSQLALEPVTKIEVDSDEQEQQAGQGSAKTTKTANTGSSSKESKESRSAPKRKSSEREQPAKKTPNSTSTEVKNISGTEASEKESDKRPTKKIKLKRNYRSSAVQRLGSEVASSTSTAKEAAENKKPTVTESKEKEVKKERQHQSRSVSPDVIPIVAEPETLVIDSTDADDEDDDQNIGLERKKKTSPSRESQLKKNTEVLSTEEREKKTEEKRRERKITEPEEGEITDNDTEPENNENDVRTEKTTKSNDKEKEKLKQDSVVDAGSKEREEENPKSSIELEEGSETISSNCAATEVKNGNSDTAINVLVETVDTQTPEKIEEQSQDQEENCRNVQSENITANVNSNDGGANDEDEDDEDDQIDDVISIDGGGDLESEMIEHLEEDTNTKSSFSANTANREEEKDADIISLDSSGDEQNKEDSESWHSRYLKSSKVSKVLATSRLGKRVRDKIKKSKRSKNDSKHESAGEEVKEKTGNAFISKHEDGSVEQYKELLEMRQRKN